MDIDCSHRYRCLSNFAPKQHSSVKTYSEFVNDLNNGSVRSVVIDNKVITGMDRSGRHFSTYMPILDPTLLIDLLRKDVVVEGKPPERQSFLLSVFINWFPMILLIGVWLWYMRQFQGGGGVGGKGPMSFGRSRARMLDGGSPIVFQMLPDVMKLNQKFKNLLILKDLANSRSLVVKFLVVLC